jgi:hypothetical protein
LSVRGRFLLPEEIPMAIPEDRTTDEHGAVLGSQRARQGQNVRGMRKVLVWGTALTAIGFALLFLIFGMQAPPQDQRTPPPPDQQSAPPPVNPS